MITKNQATVLATNFQVSLAERVAAYLLAQAQAGVVGGTFVVDTASLAQANAARTTLQNAGWTVVYDAPTQTATIT
jgi:hypothetical protein